MHQAISVSFVVIDRYGKLVHAFSYTGKDVVIKFIKDVLRCEDVLVNTTKFYKYIIFTEEDIQCFENSTICHICNNRRKNKDIPENPFTEQDSKVREHDHVVGMYLGATHKTCNLNKRSEKTIFINFYAQLFGL